MGQRSRALSTFTSTSLAHTMPSTQQLHTCTSVCIVLLSKYSIFIYILVYVLYLVMRGAMGQRSRARSTSTSFAHTMPSRVLRGVARFSATLY
jgi:hypothetical protein